jgi:hypothetical protein
VNSGGIYTTPIKTSSSNLNNVDDTFTQNTNLLSLYKYISLAGDFNARTAGLKDFSVFTENDFPDGGEYLLENYISFLTDSNTCIPASKFTYITIISYSSVHDKQVLSFAKIY